MKITTDAEGLTTLENGWFLWKVHSPKRYVWIVMDYDACEDRDKIIECFEHEETARAKAKTLSGLYVEVMRHYINPKTTP